MATPQGTATTPQEQNTNKSSQTPQPPPVWPYNGPKDEPLFVSQGESEHNSRYDSEDVHQSKPNSEDTHQSKPNSEDTLYWPCMCGDGYNSKGEWIRCEKSNCRLKWYHLACVGLKGAPPETWICRQCRARTRKVSIAKPDPKKKGVAIKVTPKKDQGRRKSWRELSSDEGEEYKRKVDSSWEVKILPGKTRSGAGQEAVYSDDGSESTENEKTPQQKTRRGRPKQIDLTSEDTIALGSDADSHVLTPGKDFDAEYSEGSADANSHVATPGKSLYADYPKGSANIGAFHDGEDEWAHAEDLRRPIDVQSPATPAPGSDFWSEDASDGNADATNDAKEGTNEGESASPAKDNSKSKDRQNVTDIASDAQESNLESDLVSNNPRVRPSRLTTPEAASTLLSIASTTAGEAHQPRTSGPVTHTEGDQALVAALRGSWVGQYFA